MHNNGWIIIMSPVFVPLVNSVSCFEKKKASAKWLNVLGAVISIFFADSHLFASGSHDGVQVGLKIHKLTLDEGSECQSTLCTFGFSYCMWMSCFCQKWGVGGLSVERLRYSTPTINEVSTSNHFKYLFISWGIKLHNKHVHCIFPLLCQWQPYLCDKIKSAG